MANPRTTADRAAHQSRPGTRALGMAALAFLVLTSASGCATGGWFSNLSFPPWNKSADTPSSPIERVSLRGEAGPDNAPADPAVAELESAKKLYYDGEYAKAEPLLEKLAGNSKNTPQIVEEALYYQADCERLRGRYTTAAELYNKLLGSYGTSGKHADQAREHLFNIANYWLDDTRAYMEACREKKEGKRWWVWPMQPIHFDKTKPFFDVEGHAVRMLEQVYMTDPKGKVAEKALFYLGSVKFFREDYRDADHYFSQLVELHPDSKLAPEALRYTIICKQMSTGGSEYDGRMLGQAIEKIHIAQVSYPELARDRSDFLTRQLYSITQQQADSDFKVAEFYRRIGRPGSAYFYYELVRRRYQGTEYAKKATERMAELKQRVDQERAKEQAREQANAKGPSGQPGSAALEAPPVPRTYTPGSPLMPLDNGPAPQTLPPGLLNDRRGP